MSQITTEWLLLATVLAGLTYIAQQYITAGHLPRPFNSDPSQSLMDFYNTAYWAHRTGAYEIWHTVYPPLSFLFSRLVTDAGCYAGSANEARACNPAGVAVIVGFYLLNIFLVYLSLRKTTVGVVFPRTLALCLGLPMLYGLELANLIIPCFTVFVLAEGKLVKSRWVRHLCRGAAFNFKLYLLVITLPSLLQGRMRWLAAAALTFVTIYLFTWPSYPKGTPWAIFTDILFYSHAQAKLYLSQNYLAEISTASGDFWNWSMPVVLRIGQGVAFFGLASGFILRDAITRRRLSVLALSILCSEAAINTQGFSADYTQIFLLFLLFREREWNLVSATLVAIAYLLCVPADVILTTAHTVSAVSFLSGRVVDVDYGLSASQFARPLLITALQIVLTAMVWRKVANIGLDRASRRLSSWRPRGRRTVKSLVSSPRPLPVRWRAWLSVRVRR